MKTNLRVLLTNIRMDGSSGTEVVTRNIALALLRQGHYPIVFTLRDGGPITRELHQASVPVITDLGKLREPIDVVHGHHHPTTAIAATRFPDVPVIFVCHDFDAWHDVPPRFANIGHYVAVDSATKDRLTKQEGIDPPGSILELVVVPFVHDRHKHVRVTARVNGIPADVRTFDKKAPSHLAIEDTDARIWSGALGYS